jgi:hypothetical protein
MHNLERVTRGRARRAQTYYDAYIAGGFMFEH